MLLRQTKTWSWVVIMSDVFSDNPAFNCCHNNAGSETQSHHIRVAALRDHGPCHHCHGNRESHLPHRHLPPRMWTRRHDICHPQHPTSCGLHHGLCSLPNTREWAYVCSHGKCMLHLFHWFYWRINYLLHFFIYILKYCIRSMLQ